MTIKKILLLVTFLGIILTKNAFSASELGIFAGFSSPNNEFNNLIPSLNDQNYELSQILNAGMKDGYHLGAMIRYDLSDNFLFRGTISWHKFPESNIDIVNPENGDTLALLTSTTNIIPITAGINFYLIKSFIGLYGFGELSYNYIYSSIDAKYGDIPLSIDKSPKDSRVGFGLGVGADLDLSITTLNLELKYSLANLIGKESEEKGKNYFAISLGILF